MYSYIWDKRTQGYLLTTQTGKYVANEIRPVFTQELSLTGLGKHFDYDRRETRPLLWAQKNAYLVADVDKDGKPEGRKVAELNGTQYGKPLNIQVFFEGKLKLEPVDIDAMVAANAEIMDIVVADAKRRTKELYDGDIKRCDTAYIAFSGGKDSVALLDICHRVLPLSVPIVFSDTDMELPDTYKVWDEIQALYPDREFICARAETSALENWRTFAPPSRTIKWCCSVHKSTPALMMLKSRLRKTAIKLMAFVGVRGDESHSRSFYEDFTEGAKNASQINCMPILDWGAHELWLYIFANDLLINCAYRKGISRIGCVMCPVSSARYIWFAQKNFPHMIKTYCDVIIETSTKNFKSVDEKNTFIGRVDWGARRSGVALKETLQDPLETNNALTHTFQSPHFKEDLFYEWIKTLGIIVRDRKRGCQLLKLSDSLDGGIPFTYSSPYTGGGTAQFEFRNLDEKKAMLPLIRSLFRKVSACKNCQSCESECTTGALSVENGKIFIDGAKCIRCRKCYDIERDCWRFNSMFKSENENNRMSGINRYNHFGLRESWIIPLLELRNDFFPWTESHPLGNKMVQSASSWFQQALLVQSKTRKPTLLVDLFGKFGSTHMVGWELIWIALANNSVLIKWFVSIVDFDKAYIMEQLAAWLRESNPELGQSTIKDGLTSLKETITRSPLSGNNGIAEVIMKGRSVQSITRKAKDVHPLTILYGLYLIADKAKRGNFNVSRLLTADIESAFVSPIVAFGITPDRFKKQCEGLRTRYPDYISTSFTHGNDGLEVFSEKYNFEDIIKLALED